MRKCPGRVRAMTYLIWGMISALLLGFWATRAASQQPALHEPSFSMQPRGPDAPQRRSDPADDRITPLGTQPDVTVHLQASRNAASHYGCRRETRLEPTRSRHPLV